MIWRGDALLALLFRLENSPDTAQAVVLTDAALAWFRRHPGFEPVRRIFTELLGAVLAPLAPGVRVPEELLEVRNMLATRAEAWKQQWLQEAEQKGRKEASGRQGEGGGREARRRRLCAAHWSPGSVRAWLGPGFAVAAADTAALEKWGLRILDAGSLDDVLA